VGDTEELKKTKMRMCCVAREGSTVDRMSEFTHLVLVLRLS